MIIVTGATGFIGRDLCGYVRGRGGAVCAVSRDPAAAAAMLGSDIDVLSWEDFLERPSSPLRGPSYSIINLAGENVGRGSWTKARRQQILTSRVEGVRKLVRAIMQSPSRPKVFIQASGIGYYGDGGDIELTEEAPAGHEFLSEVAKRCEHEAAMLSSQGIRTVHIRTAVVLGRGGGALSRMIEPFRWYAGGVPGGGKQYVSWIHIEDEVRAIAHLLERDDLAGPFNLTVPHPVDAKTFFTELGSVLGKPAFLPMPAALIKLAMGQKGVELLLSSKRAIPERLLASGFTFRHPDLREALCSILTN